jgi:SAM-dependent methyltransferase
MNGLKQKLQSSWLFPRYISVVNLLPAMTRSRSYAGGTLVDVGCGKRQYQKLFEPVIRRYIGVDWPVSLEHASPDVVGDALHLPLPDQLADTVLSTELMEHLPDPHVFLAEVARVIKPNGHFILSVPFLEPLHEEPRDFFRFTPYSLRRLLSEHGFEVQHIWSRGGWGSVTIGSFISQALYEWANPLDSKGRRSYPLVRTALVLPICALAQMIGYTVDHIVTTPKYTLGFVVVATRTAQEQ